MITLEKSQLNHCQAWVYRAEGLNVLRSYDTIVAAESGGRVFVFPECKYSNTTVKHFYKWLRKFGIAELLRSEAVCDYYDYIELKRRTIGKYGYADVDLWAIANELTGF